jgi:RNA recognition motif-containing protein
MSDEAKIFVGGLSWSTSDEGLEKYFSQYAQVTHANIVLDRNTGKPRGFGFVTFADQASIATVMAQVHNIDGKTVELKRAASRGEAVPHQDKGGMQRHNPANARINKQRDQNERKIFVGGLLVYLTGEDLTEYFGKYGQVEDSRVMIDRNTGRSRGFGFVTFASTEDVDNVIRHRHTIQGKSVEIKRAEFRGKAAANNTDVAASTPAIHDGTLGGFGGSGYGLIYGAHGILTGNAPRGHNGRPAQPDQGGPRAGPGGVAGKRKREQSAPEQ